MTNDPNDALLMSGKILTGVFQVVCALVAGVMLVLIPAVLLISQDMLPGFSGASRSETITASPVSVLAIVSMLALILAAMFLFFAKLRAIIVSVGEGDPFTPENARRLNAMAWLFLGVKILTLLIVGLRSHLASLMDKGASGGNVLGFSMYDLDAIVIVLVLFILARIFRQGAAMREELKGTI